MSLAIEYLRSSQASLGLEAKEAGDFCEKLKDAAG